MKYILMLGLFLTGCIDSNNRFEKLKPPIIVIARSENCIILKDVNGLLYEGKNGWYIGEALIHTYKVGDTLK